MFVFRKPKPAVYHSESTGADFKFRQSNEDEAVNLYIYVNNSHKHRHKDNMYVEWNRYYDDYYAAWLMEDFSGVEENGKACDIDEFDLHAKFELVKKLKQLDTEFSAWFASHCEGAEKKDGKNDSAGEVVGSEGVQGL